MTAFKPFKLAADVVVREDSKTLMVKEKKEGFEGLWGLPGGGVEDGETPRKAAKREVREETGLEIELGELVGIYIIENKSIGKDVLVFIYGADRLGGEIEVEFTGEIEDAEFIDVGEVSRQDFRDPELTKVVIRDYRKDDDFERVKDLRNPV